MNSELLNLIGNAPKVTLGEYIVRVERANSAGAYGAEDVRGVSNTKGFMETRANIEGRSLKKFLVIEPFEFVFNPKSRSKPSRYSSENDVLIEKSVKYTDFFLLSIVYV